MFTLRIKVIKCQKWLFFVFSTENSTKSVPVWAKCLSASERSYSPLSENTMED